jgi:putative ABC transport system permease protein
MRIFGRLKPGVPLRQSNADLSTIASRLERDYPKSYPKSAGYGITSVPLRSELTGHAQPMLLLLLGAAAFVLLIACANVANLAMARMAQRERELMIRTAVGAGAARLLRQLLTENLILALTAGCTGVLFAAGGLHLLADFAAQLTPRSREISIDGWVLLFTIASAVATTVAIGSLSALHTRADLSKGLRVHGSQGGPAVRRNLVRGALIAAQVGFSYMLMIGAGLMVRSFIHLEEVDGGFVPQRVLAVGFDLNWSKYTWGSEAAVAKRLLEEVQSKPGVAMAAVASSFPLDPDVRAFHSVDQAFRIEGEPPSETPPIANLRTVTPGYFQTLGISLEAGRFFRESDGDGAPLVAVISRSLARKRWGGQNPVGRQITFNRGKNWVTVVGIAGDVKEFGLAREAPEQLYLPLWQGGWSGSILVRTEANPATLANQVRHAIRDVDPEISITEIKTLEEARYDSMSSPRSTARLFGLFAGLALLIAIAGVGSMLALSVRQRVQEIGIRMALGATPGDIIGMVVLQGMRLVAFGVAAGLIGAVALTGTLKATLFEVTPTDLPTYALVSLLLAGAALAAAYVPARRAACIDPQIALRCE